MVVNPNSPIAEIANPIGVSNRDPTRSESRPLKGPITINAAPKGMSINPDWIGDLCDWTVRVNYHYAIYALLVAGSLYGTHGWGVRLLHLAQYQCHYEFCRAAYARRGSRYLEHAE